MSMRTGRLLLLLVGAAQAFVRPGSPRVTSSRRGVELRATGKVASLLSSKRKQVDALATVAPGMSELTLLRFALAFPSQAEAKRALAETVAWRKGSGKKIVEAAASAVEAATAGGGWDNEAVRLGAPHAASINRYITPKNILTLSTDEGDLVYVLRASLIDDNALMRAVSVKELSEFFAYVKEVHSLVANARSERTGRLAEVLFANDVSGIRAVPIGAGREGDSTSLQQECALVPEKGSTVRERSER